MPTPQEYAKAHKRAVEAGNIEAANEIAAHLNALAESSKPSFLDEPMQKEVPVAYAAPQNRSVFSGTPTPVSFRTPGGTAFVQGVGKAMDESNLPAAAVRYGIPIAGGLATAPLIPATAAGVGIASLVGAGLSYAGEKGAQKIEGVDSPKEVARAAMLGGVPFIGQGRSAVRVLANVPAQIAGQTAAEVVLDGMTLDDYKKEMETGDAWKRWGASMAITGGLSLLGGRGEKFSRVANKKDFLELSRQGGTAMLHEYMPERSWFSPRLWSYESLEGNALNRKNLNAVRLNEGMTSGIGPAILMAFPEVENGTEAATYLRRGYEEVQGMLKKSMDATKAAREATAAYDEALMNNRPVYRQLKEKAEQSAFSAVHADVLNNVVKDKWFPRLDQSVKAVSEASVSDDVLRLADAAKGRVKSVNDGLYEAAGVGLNTPVLSVTELRRAIAEGAKEKGSLLQGNIARKEFVEDLETLLRDKAKDGLVTKELYVRLKNEMADGLVANRKMDVRAANKLAGERYQVVKRAADAYMKKQMPEEQYKAWNLAQSSFAKNIQELDSGAMEMLRKGKANELVKSMLEHKGAGATHLNELKAYSDVIRTTFDPAIEGAQKAANDAADVFEAGINRSLGNALMDGVIRDTSGFGSVMTTASMEKLAGNLAKLEKNGFPNIAALGFGSPDDINKLARLADTGRTNFTKEDVNAFFAMLPSVGANQAAAAVKYRKGISESFLLEGDARIRRQLQLNKEAKNARLDAKMQKELYQSAKNDPILSFMEESGSGLKLGENLADDFNLTDRFLTVDPRLLTGLFDRLRKNQPDVANKLGKVAVRRFMLHLESEMTSGATDKINLGKILDNWNGRDDASKVIKQNMVTMAGDDVTRVIDEGLIKEMKRIVGVRSKMGELYPPAGKSVVQGYARLSTGAGGIEGGKGITGMLPSMVGVPVANLIGFLKEKRYNLAYAMYADPKWAPQFRAVGYNIDKFAAQGPVQRALVLANLHADEKERQRETEKAAQSSAAK